MVIRGLHDLEIVEGQVKNDLEVEQIFTLRDLDVVEVEDHAQVALIIHWAEEEARALIEEDVERVWLIPVIRENMEVMQRNNGRGKLSKVVGDVSRCGSVHSGKQV
jgi:DNA helicase TIP49 (TBP-interacting protein)